MKRRRWYDCHGAGLSPSLVYDDRGKCRVCAGVFGLNQSGRLRPHRHERRQRAGGRAAA